MKYPLYSLAVLFVLIAWPAAADARTVVGTGEFVSLGEEQEVEGDFYGLGNNVSVSGTVSGDLYAAGASVILNGHVDEDIFLVGGFVNVHASTSDDLRIMGGDVTIAGFVAGNVAIAGGRVSILSTANIAGDVLVYGNDVTIEGNIDGRLLGKIHTVRIDGQIAGGVDIESDRIILGDQAVLQGDFRYQSREEVVRAPGAIIDGDMVPVAVETETDSGSSISPQTVVVAFLIQLFTALCLYLLTRGFIVRFVPKLIERPAYHGLIGLLAVFLPVGAAILMTTVLGSVLGAMLLFGFILCFLLALPLTTIFTGMMISSVILKRKEISPLSITLGALTLQLLVLIPVLGALIVFCLVLITVGHILREIYHLVRSA